MVLRNVVPRQGTETKKVTETKKDVQKTKDELRNVVPRQGTETRWIFYSEFLFGIEKCSSPTGDGN